MTAQLKLNTTAGGSVTLLPDDTAGNLVISPQTGYYLPAGTGAVATTVQTKLRESVSVKDFGAVGDGVTDDTAAIQAALTAHLAVDFGTPENTYKLSDTLIPRSNQKLFGGGLLKQTTSQKVIFNVAGLTNVEFDGMRFEGLRSDYVDSSSSLAVAIRAITAASNINIHNCQFKWFGYSPFFGGSVTGFTFTDNVVVGPGLVAAGGTLIANVTRNNTGVTVGGSNIVVTGNRISETGQGAIISSVSENIIFANNAVFDIRVEHGIYCDAGLLNLTITGNSFKNAYGSGIKVQQNTGSPSRGTKGVAITGNSVYTTILGDGILVNNTEYGTNPYLLEDVVVTGNSIYSVGAEGINIRYTNNSIVANNTVDTVGDIGVFLSTNTNLTVSGNTVINTQSSGIIANSAATGLNIVNNNVCNSGLNGVADYLSTAILITAGNEILVKNNTIVGDVTKTLYGIYVAGGTNSTISIVGNQMQTIKTYGIRFGVTDALREYRDNYLNGLTAIAFNDPVLPVVASTAAVTLPEGSSIFFISGTATITSISVTGRSGRQVTLIFQDALTVTDGSNLTLAGNFVTTANDTLTLVSNGSAWYEIARSVN